MPRYKIPKNDNSSLLDMCHQKLSVNRKWMNKAIQHVNTGE
ncbi:MAG: hypothetical protein ACH350_03775 [Parachlamydiaceae bacterium]